MNLNQKVINNIDRIIDEYITKKIILEDELIIHIFFENKEYIQSSMFLTDYFEETLKSKSSNMVDNAFILFNDNPKKYIYSKDILNSINILLLENWHSFQEKSMYTILMNYSDKASLPYLKKAAIWKDKAIEVFEDGFHKDAIRGILQIAKEDSIDILENLVGKVDEQTAPFLERKIKEAKEIYLDS